MAIETAKVQGRRKLHYQSYQEVIDDAEQLRGRKVRSLGNWSLGQVLKHLGEAMDSSVDGIPFQVPWWVRLAGVLYYRRKLIKGPFPAGFQLPGRARRKLVASPETSYEEGMTRFGEGIAKLASTTARVPHPAAGTMTADQWDQFHLRHAELHMSFLVPG